MIIVSGCPRSGTSMMMRIMEKVFGEDRILGNKNVDRLEKANEQTAKRIKKMNPNGYYEMEFCVQGIKYLPKYEELLSKPSDKVVKVVSQGLAMSDPRHIDKIVFMARNPFAVAKSQENLSRGDLMNPEDAPIRDGKRVLVRSVEMYNRVTIAAARWILDHPAIPVHIVNYDELLDNPGPALDAIGVFLGADMSPAVDMIDTTLRRSKPVKEEGFSWTFAGCLHPHLLSGDWQAIIDEISKHERPKPEEWICRRLDKKVCRNQCELCMSHSQTRNNFRKSATGDWRKEPCAYEMMNGVSREQSIANNHWAVDAGTAEIRDYTKDCSKKFCRLGNRECDSYRGCRDICRISSKIVASMDTCPQD